MTDDARRRPRDRFGRPLPPGSPDELPGRGDPAADTPDWREAVARGVELFDAERFFEAHEFFEHAWKSAAAPPAARRLWKACAQLAVACCHVQRGNHRGAVVLFERAATTASGAADENAVAAADIAATARAAGRRLAAGPSEAFRFPRFPGAE